MTPSTGIALNATNGTVVPFRVMSLHGNRLEVELSSGELTIPIVHTFHFCFHSKPLRIEVEQIYHFGMY